jgi:outer membrane lipoprotein SlyB
VLVELGNLARRQARSPMENTGAKRRKYMTTFRVFGLSALAVLILAPDATAQRRGGGAVSGGMRGAVVGGMVGGESGAQTGAKVGAVTGATRGAAQRSENRNAVYAENQARAQYATTAAYQSVQHSNFNEAPPEVIVTSASAPSATSSGEAATRKNATSEPAASGAKGKETALPTKGKPIVWITYPAEWKQKTTERSISAVSADGHAWSGLGILEGAKNKQAGIKQVQQSLEKYLQNVNYDDPTETKGDSLVVTGTGKAKKAGVDVVFAAGVFDAGQGQLACIAFVADKDLEDHYKEAARYICQTIRTGTDLVQPK